ncbi:MAG: 23S rRNA (pseudouridine(1915)-N(3))-methyltransferase RlmH [Clostridiaceae bacterium]|nr:23S rRNA (pseudouridine(1915)-N(3))-methyltransferase RlmH [Clostridiaceae bacterium]
MINITVIALGKLKEKYMRDFCDEYVKRLSAYCKLNIIELAPKSLSDNPSQTEIAQALSAEAQMIKAKIPQNSYVFSMCIEGKQMPSEAFSQKLSKLAIDGKSSIVFIIGSSFGLDGEIKKLSDERFSMSEMTFPHQMARVMLLEQLYRAFQISSGGKYHK